MKEITRILAELTNGFVRAFGPIASVRQGLQVTDSFLSVQQRDCFPCEPSDACFRSLSPVWCTCSEYLEWFYCLIYKAKCVFLAFELNVCDFVFEKRVLLFQAIWAICGKDGLFKVEEACAVQPPLLHSAWLPWVVTSGEAVSTGPSKAGLPAFELTGHWKVLLWVDLL